MHQNTFNGECLKFFSEVYVSLRNLEVNEVGMSPGTYMLADYLTQDCIVKGYRLTVNNYEEGFSQISFKPDNYYMLAFLGLTLRQSDVIYDELVENLDPDCQSMWWNEPLWNCEEDFFYLYEFIKG